MEHGTKHGLAVRALFGLLALALFGQPVLAQNAQDEQADAADASVVTLESIDVVGAAEDDAPIKIGNTAGASQEDIERRNASHVTDLINQISGTSMNSRYASPEVSVGVQGIAGYGRVAQSLEGIRQDFQAFAKDIGQTGSIFIEPNFLRSIDVTRGVNTSTNTLGSLGASVDFRYLDVEDILFPDKDFGGMLRGTTGFSKYSNGQKLSGQLFLGGRSERWEAMIGVSDAENEAYRIGSNFNDGDMLKYFHATNTNIPGRSGGNGELLTACRYLVLGVTGGVRDRMSNCQFTPEELRIFKQAAKSGVLPGTEKKTDSQMLRVRHLFNDDFDQKLEFFASASHAKFQTDQNPKIMEPTDGSDAYWGKDPWLVRANFDNRVYSLKYTANMTGLINPEVQVYREQQDRKQRWIGLRGSIAPGEDMHYFIDAHSTGIKLANASHFSAPLMGALRLDTTFELHRADKEVDILGEEDYTKRDRERRGLLYHRLTWDTDGRTTSHGIALNLSTENESPWQVSLGAGWQHVKLDIYDPVYKSGNVARAGRYPSASKLYQEYRSQGYSNADARALAQAKVRESSLPFFIDAEKGNLGYMRYIYDDQKHHYNLKSANVSVQYTRPGTGFASYAKIGYSERPPSNTEMYASGVWMRQDFAVNPSLNPEENISLQLGVNYRKSALLTSADEFGVELNYYRNRIRNKIDYGPMFLENEGIGTGQTMYIANVNNLEAVIRHGFELNLAYRQPLFYLRSNLTIPLRHNNKQCSWQVPSGRAYYRTTENGNTVFTPTGKGERLCYSGWNWMETGLIEPLRGSLTLAFTPGQFELGSTVHYRGKQRAAYWYLPDRQFKNNHDKSLEKLPDNDGWIYANLWPKSIKVDLFANYRVNDHLKMGIYVANLTDQFDGGHTTLGYGFHPGRTVTANLEYRF